MSNNQSEVNPKAYEQWNLWCEEKFGGLPKKAILSDSASTGGDENSAEPDKLFFISRYWLNRIDESQPYMLVIDDRFLSDEKLDFVGLGEEPKIDYYREQEEDYPYFSDTADYAITENSISKYLEKMAIKEELKGKESLLSLIICAFLNRDCYRMYEAMLSFLYDGFKEDSPRIQRLLKQSLLDRDSTTAQIKALCLDKVISPLKAENAIAGQESAPEGKTGNNAFVIPKEIDEKFRYFVDKSKELIRTKEGFLIVNREITDFQGFYTQVSNRREGNYIVPTREEIIEFVRKRDGSKYSMHSLKPDKEELK